MGSFEQGLAVESWTLWAAAVLTVACRLASRRMNFKSFKQYQLDDYLAIISVFTLTGVVVSSNQVAISGSNYVAEGVVDTWTTDQVERATWGSKMLVVLEEFMLTTLWVVKAGLLLLYYRMTSLLPEGVLVKALAVYCAIGYIITQSLYLGYWCRPIYNYWAVPVPPGHEQCLSYHDHMITATVFHVSSDLALLCIPLPLIARAHLPLKRKLVLCGVFSLGVAVVIVAILNRYYNFTVANSLIFLNWYNGEAATAVMIANIPFCWTLLRRMFALDAWMHSSAGPPTIGSAANRHGRRGKDQVIIGRDVCHDSGISSDRRGLHPLEYQEMATKKVEKRSSDTTTGYSQSGASEDREIPSCPDWDDSKLV